MAVLPTYPSGYAGARRTIPQIRLQSDVRMLDPEFRRRLLMMMKAAKKAGVDLGIGQAGRSAAQQRAVFLERHFLVPANGCCSLDGKRYMLRSGKAHAAPPGRSYHEETTPAGGALAADMVGDLKWMNANCGWFGLVHFASIGNEPWHVQPAELPKSRAQYVPAMHPLKKWG